MRKHALRSLVLIVLAALSLTVVRALADEHIPEACASTGEDAQELDRALLYVEYNFTDGDLGVHGVFNADGIAALCVFKPDGTLMLVISPTEDFGELGMGEIFFESREPELDEFGFDELHARYPEGEYSVRGLTHEGDPIGDSAYFTHAVAAPPAILAPEVEEDEEDGEELLVPVEDFVVEWEAVTATVDGDPVEIVAYEIVITNEDVDEGSNSLSVPIYDVHVGPDQTRLSVPAEFFEPDALYELEIIAIEASGNQTISLGFFATEE